MCKQLNLFRLVLRSKFRRFSLTFRFKSKESHEKGFKILNLKKTGTATLSSRPRSIILYKLIFKNVAKI